MVLLSSDGGHQTQPDPLPPLFMKKKKTTPSHRSEPKSWSTTEGALTAGLSEDLLEAWQKLRAFAAELGEPRIYASGKAIMFSRRVCFFFVRPRKTFLEVVVFLTSAKKRAGFRSVKPVSKTKFAHTFKLIHGDQIEGELTDSIREASEVP